MKKTRTTATSAAILAIAALATLTSCGKGDSPATESFGQETGVLITPDEETTPSTACLSRVELEYDLDDKTATFTLKDLVALSKTISFRAEAIPYTQSTYYNGTIRTFEIPQMTAIGSATTATDLKAKISTLFSYNPVEGVLMNVARQLDIKFRIDNNATAQTFTPNGYYKGTTVTHYVYNNQQKEYSNNEIVYEVVMNLTNSTAVVRIYNPVFAEEMPQSMKTSVLLLEGLKMRYTHGHIIVEGNNIVPQRYEGSGYTPFPAFTFRDFSFRTSSENLRSAQISFNVAENYSAMAAVTVAL